jgi:hypothetical protein
LFQETNEEADSRVADQFVDCSDAVFGELCDAVGFGAFSEVVVRSLGLVGGHGH